MSNSTLGRHGIDRRTLLKAGAWAAPAIVVATAAPAAAASAPPAPLADPKPSMPSLNPSYSDPAGKMPVGGTVALSPTITAGSQPTGALTATVTLGGGSPGRTGVVLYPTNNGWSFTQRGDQYVMTHPGLQPGESATPSFTVQRIGDGASGSRTITLILKSDQGGNTLALPLNLA